MGNRENLRDKLLRADGIDPSAVSEVELARFRHLLNRAKPAAIFWRTIMRTPVAKLTIAAAVIVFVAVIAMHFYGGTSSTAWSAVLENVLTFDTCVCRTREVQTTGPRPDGFEFATDSESKKYRSETYGSFSENYRNGELFTRMYHSLLKGEFVAVCYPLKTYTRLPLTESQIRGLQKDHPRQIITKILEANYTELGEDVMEGKRVRGVELRGPDAFADGDAKMPPLDDFVAQFWIEAETQLPVWVEVSVVPKGSQVRHTTVVDQFQWGVPLQASLFEPDIPADFERDNPEDRNIYMDSAPKTRTAEAFAENTQAEPYLSDFDHLELPDLGNLTLLGLDTSMAQPELRLRDHEDVWQRQDEFMAQWPGYEDVRDQIALQLDAELGIEQMTIEELIGLGIALRERFWELRGCLSEVAYPYGYAARIVTEMAHAQAPDDTAVTDQFIESIMTCEVTSTSQAGTDERIKNPVYPGLLTELRSQQFEQLKAKVSEGYVPTWKDHVRLHDLVTLLSSNCQDYDGALQVTRWMIDQAQTAGWTYYLDTRLNEMEQAYAAGEGYRTGLFMYGQDAFPDEFRYARRLFSFQGPRKRSRELLPVHLRHLKGW
ncbi:MAG: hypothetical protein JSU70_08430 [Phycisphaerales bacterium]|nr:MAG: hypothetical protein JSU70_08430 [Phycisphaerales bacterium]